MTTRTLCLLVALAAPKVALADAKSEAADHIARAQTAHDAGKFTDALNELVTAYTLDPQPQLLYAIGQVQRDLGRCDQAITYYKRFLETHPDHDSAAVAEEAIASCKDQPTKPPDEPHPPPPPPPPPQPPRPVAAPADAPAFYTDKLGDALVGAGVVAGVVAIVEYKSALSDLDSADKAATFDARAKLEDDAHGKRTLAVVFAIGGVALAGGGVAHYLLHDRGGAETGVAIIPTAHGGFVTWSGGF
jgi:tetratricopeptide (TPR) repeat protein